MLTFHATKITALSMKDLLKQHKEHNKQKCSTQEPYLLTTEKPHPKTIRLSQLSQTALLEAISVLQQADLAALEKLKQYEDKLQKLSNEI